MYAYFQACNSLDISEERDGHNKNSFLWCNWFGFYMRLQGILAVIYAPYLYYIEGYNIEQPITAVVGVILFGLSFVVLNKSKVGWFVATVFTLNPVFWVLNVLYYNKNKECFK